MTEKNVDQALSFRGLQIQLEIVQQLLLAIIDMHGIDRAEAALEETVAKLDPHHAAILRGLVAAMRADAIGEAGDTVH